MRLLLWQCFHTEYVILKIESCRMLVLSVAIIGAVSLIWLENEGLYQKYIVLHFKLCDWLSISPTSAAEPAPLLAIAVLPWFSVIHTYLGTSMYLE